MRRHFSIIIALVILAGLVGLGLFLNFKIKVFFKENQTASDLLESYQSFQGQNQNGFSFLVIGDSENQNGNLGPALVEFVAAANQSGAAFIVHLGDFTHQGTNLEMREFKEYLSQNLKIPYRLVCGNHDTIADDYTKNNFQNNFGYHYYSFDHRQNHFIVLENADNNVGFSAKQLEFLANDLNQNQDKDQIFVFTHRPFNIPLANLFDVSDGETKTAKESYNRFEEIVNQPRNGKPLIAEIYAGHVHTYYTYTLGAVPVTITGGGGSKKNLSFLENLKSFPHYLDVRVDGKTHQNQIKELKKTGSEPLDF